MEREARFNPADVEMDAQKPSDDDVAYISGRIFTDESDEPLWDATGQCIIPMNVVSEEPDTDEDTLNPIESGNGYCSTPGILHILLGISEESDG